MGDGLGNLQWTSIWGLYLELRIIFQMMSHWIKVRSTRPETPLSIIANKRRGNVFNYNKPAGQGYFALSCINRSDRLASEGSENSVRKESLSVVSLSLTFTFFLEMFWGYFWCNDINGLVFVSVNIIKQIRVTTETLINNITTSGEARREARREGRREGRRNRILK